jgi:hypothetical protein
VVAKLFLPNDAIHYWAPIPEIMNWLTDVRIKSSDRVLDIGPGHNPFARADVAVDFVSEEQLQKLWDHLKVQARPPKLVQANVACTRLPFADKEFDFVFCRHTIEDMADPELLLSEMSRVGKAGYIETPSPICELTRGVDGFGNGTMWRGYHHHRQIVWVEENVLSYVTKYPIVEHMAGLPDDKLVEALKYAEVWNTYYVWSDEITWCPYHNPIHFDFGSEENNYGALLLRACEQSAKATHDFCLMVQSQTKKAA